MRSQSAVGGPDLQSELLAAPSEGSRVSSSSLFSLSLLTVRIERTTRDHGRRTAYKEAEERGETLNVPCYGAWLCTSLLSVHPRADRARFCQRHVGGESALSPAAACAVIFSEAHPASAYLHVLSELRRPMARRGRSLKAWHLSLWLAAPAVAFRLPPADPPRCRFSLCVITVFVLRYALEQLARLFRPDMGSGGWEPAIRWPNAAMFAAPAAALRSQPKAAWRVMLGLLDGEKDELLLSSFGDRGTSKQTASLRLMSRINGTDLPVRASRRYPLRVLGRPALVFGHPPRRKMRSCGS